MAHRLDPLLRPRSIAIVGATERAHSVGRRTVHNLQSGGFAGPIYPVNPGRETVLGLSCYPDLASLPETVDHVAFAVNDQRIEAALGDAIAHGARAATIMSQLILPGDSAPRLQQRVEGMIREAGLLVCGANAMGFYNCRDGIWLCGFDTRENHPRGGNVTLISHSGSGMSGILDCEERIDFNLAVSTGQEINTGMHDYMDFALTEHGPRAIGLFMETARQPEAFISVLEKASAKGVPVVAIKVGRTALSARLAQSHSGAMAGEDAAYEALFERYGVHRVADMDEFATTLIMFAQPHPVADGGLVALHDSGGERQLLIDLADEMNTPIAEISERTVAALEARLDPGLPPVNPLDAWGAGGPDSDRIMQDCLAALMSDPAAALGAVVHDRAPLSTICTEYVDYMRTAHAASGKPVFLVANRQGTGSDPAVVEVTREGFPVLDGLRSFLAGVNCLLAHRDFLRRPAVTAQVPDPAATRAALEMLEMNVALDEAQSLECLGLFGIPVNPTRIASSEEEAVRHAGEFGYPVVLKALAPGLQHKTERDAVHLGLHDEGGVRSAWRKVESILGPKALIAPMIHHRGVEMALGMVRDEQFGPLVMLGIGGVKVEAVSDVVYALPPFDATTARRRVGGLKLAATLTFDRGAGLPDLDAYCEAAAKFSSMVASLGDAIDEIDINPLIVHAGGCVAVDALVIGRGAGKSDTARKTP